MEPQWLCASCWRKEKSLGFVTFSGNKKQMVYKSALLPRGQNLCREVLVEMEGGVRIPFSYYLNPEHC